MPMYKAKYKNLLSMESTFRVIDTHLYFFTTYAIRSLKTALLRFQSVNSKDTLRTFQLDLSKQPKYFVLKYF
jgi:hypothetical protein